MDKVCEILWRFSGLVWIILRGYTTWHITVLLILAMKEQHVLLQQCTVHLLHFLGCLALHQYDGFCLPDRACFRNFVLYSFYSSSAVVLTGNDLDIVVPTSPEMVFELSARAIAFLVLANLFQYLIHRAEHIFKLEFHHGHHQSKMTKESAFADDLLEFHFYLLPILCALAAYFAFLTDDIHAPYHAYCFFTGGLCYFQHTIAVHDSSNFSKEKVWFLFWLDPTVLEKHALHHSNEPWNHFGGPSVSWFDDLFKMISLLKSSQNKASRRRARNVRSTFNFLSKVVA